MRVSAPAVSRTAVGFFLAAALALVAVIDGGSVVMSRLAVPDDTLTAGHAAAKAAEGLPVTEQTAVVAFEAAQRSATPQGLTVGTDDFQLYADGRVTLTASRVAPTLVFKHLPMLRDLAQVTSTATVSALPFS